MLTIWIVIVSVMVAQVYVLMLEPRMILDWLCQYIERLHPRLVKLLTCSTCMAGQIAFWTYPIAEPTYSITAHLLTVTATIWVAHVTNPLLFNE